LRGEKEEPRTFAMEAPDAEEIPQDVVELAIQPTEK
jgi:hypothetical protein